VVWRIEGTSLMGNPVAESYRFEDGRARWTSQADRGEVAAGSPPLYVVNDGSPWALGIYARALLATPDRTLRVLPGGALSLAAVAEVRLGKAGDAVDVTVYRIGGVDLAPELVALDAQQRLFAVPGATSLVVREGFESLAPELLELARELETRHARELQRRL